MLSRLPARLNATPAPEEQQDSVRGNFFPADLPVLESDPFGWTPEELEDAVRTARGWLFDPSSKHVE